MKSSLATLFLLVFGVVCFAQPAEHPGIKLFRERKYAEARVALAEAVKEPAFRGNAGFWNILGLSHAAEGNHKDARKALETAVSVDPAVAAYQANLAFVYLSLSDEGKARQAANRALDLDPKNAQALSIRGSAFYRDNKLDEAERDARALISLEQTRPDGYSILSQVLISRLGRKLGGKISGEDMAEIEAEKALLEAGLAKCVGGGCSDLKDDLEGLAAWLDFAKNPAEHDLASQPYAPPPPPPPGVTPLKILSKPRPGYTDEARTSNTQGRIRIAILFRKDGRLQPMFLLRGLGKGLDAQALTAARKIAFDPMKIDGKPVSIVKALEYSFSIY